MLTVSAWDYEILWLGEMQSAWRHTQPKDAICPGANGICLCLMMDFVVVVVGCTEGMRGW